MRLFALILVAGCVPEPEPVGPSFQRDVAPLFWRECDGCHQGDEPDAGLDLWDAPYDSIVGVPSTQADMALVEPGDHLYSYLWHKINGTQGIAGGSGTAMPLDGLLDDDEVALVAEWIDAGAEP